MTITIIHFIAPKNRKNEHNGNREMIIFGFDEKNKSNLFYNTDTHPIVLLILPADYFDKGQSICVSVLLFDKNCYACGMTRAIQHLIHLDFQQASEFNKLSLVLPLLIVSYYNTLKKVYKKIK